jgi:hypothetical protein
MAEKIRTAYVMLVSTRDLLVKLAEELKVTQSEILHEAVHLYLAAVEMDKAELPERDVSGAARGRVTG